MHGFVFGMDNLMEQQQQQQQQQQHLNGIGTGTGTSGEKAKSHLVWVATTRFNNVTWKENVDYRARKAHLDMTSSANTPVCLYPVPQPMSLGIPPYGLVLVLEMNNTENRLEGVGIVRNVLARTHHRVYTDPNYNRYAYVGHYRVDRSDWIRLHPTLLTDLETLCFRGKGHFKRGAGITHLHRRAAIWETPLVELFCHLYSENPSLLLSLPSTSTSTSTSTTTTTTTTTTTQ